MTHQKSLSLLPWLLAMAAGPASASGFQLLEQSGSGLGNAYAGSAAIAENASTIFYNPAGLSLLSGKQFSAGLSVIDLKVKFSNRATTKPSLINSLGSEGGEGGDIGYVPNIYLSMPVTDDLTFGLGVNAPFGLKTSYSDDWMGRFQAIKSDLKTANINPTLAFKASDSVALGFGVNWQKIQATLSGTADTSALVFSKSGGGVNIADLESKMTLNGSDTAWGYNFGALFTLSEATRVGVSYRSAISYHVTGRASFQNPITGNGVANTIIAGALYDGGISLDVKLPDTWLFSGYHKLDDRWELLGDASRTGWQKIPKLDVLRTDGGQDGSILSHTQENWRNTWRFALGANYQYNADWKLKMGAAYDQSPVNNDAYRTPRLPDTNRKWLSFGAQYKLSPTERLDVGYAHLFIPKSLISNNGQGADASSKGLLDGEYRGSVNIFSAQYSAAF